MLTILSWLDLKRVFDDSKVKESFWKTFENLWTRRSKYILNFSSYELFGYLLTIFFSDMCSQVRQLTSCLNLTSKNTETIASCKAVFEVVRSLIKGILYRCLKIMFMVYDMVSMLKYMCFWHFVCPTRPWFSNVIWYGHFVFSIWGDTWLFVILILVKLLTITV